MNIHDYRIYGYAIVDIIFTLLFALFIYPEVSIRPVILFVLLVLISIPIHLMFGVDTKLTKTIFGK